MQYAIYNMQYAIHNIQYVIWFSMYSVILYLYIQPWRRPMILSSPLVDILKVKEHIYSNNLSSASLTQSSSSSFCCCDGIDQVNWFNTNCLQIILCTLQSIIHIIFRCQIFSLFVSIWISRGFIRHFR